jgi:hypothetical protein
MKRARGSDGVRSPGTLHRGGKIHVHASVYERTGVEVHDTIRPPSDGRSSA